MVLDFMLESSDERQKKEAKIKQSHILFNTLQETNRKLRINESECVDERSTLDRMVRKR